MALGTRAIARLPGSGNGGFAGAKKLADLYVATNTNDAGEVKDPAIYGKVIDEILAPYAGTLDGQNLIADYNNKMKKLTAEKNESQTDVASLKQKEYSAWYVNDDGENDTSFRNPEWVANVTSESLDMILAETLDLREQRASENKSTADIDGYITELSKRADRMRTISTQLKDGQEANLDGYGYYIDSDPNTGVIRGASFMPTDAGFNELSKNTIRTDSLVTVAGKKVPVYLPYVQQEDGTKMAKFGGTEFTGTKDLLEGGAIDIALADTVSYPSQQSSIEVNKIYQTFTGKTNVDGSFKKDYLYISPDSKVYRFGEDDQKGKELIKSMQEIAGVTEIPRLSPADANEYYSEPLPDDSTPIVNKALFTTKMAGIQQDQVTIDAESERLKNQGSIGAVIENAPGVIGNAIASPFRAAASFFGRKNRQNVPDKPTASINGSTSAPEVVAQGASFFRNKV